MVVDWHLAVDVATNGFGMRGSQIDSTAQQAAQKARSPPVVSIKSHSSCSSGKKNGQPGTISLEDCLDAFSKEEKIPEVRR